MIIDKRTFKKIEYYLYNSDRLKQAIEQTRKQLIEAGNPEMAGGISGISYHSDPTAGKAIKLSTNRIAECEKWIKTVEQVRKKYQGTDKAKFIEAKYGKGLSEREVCKQLFISRTTFMLGGKKLYYARGS